MFLFLSLLLIMLFVIGVLGFRLSVKNDSESEMIISLLIIVISFISIWILGYLQRNGMDVFCYLSGHINKSKTVINKENDIVTDVYITVDGEEYHFDLRNKECK